jgi:hypothetical protein
MSPLSSGLKQVFHIDIETCEPCGGAVKIIASVEDPAVIKTIFAHLEKTSRTPATRASPPAAKHNTFSPSKVVFP